MKRTRCQHFVSIAVSLYCVLHDPDWSCSDWMFTDCLSFASCASSTEIAFIFLMQLKTFHSGIQLMFSPSSFPGFGIWYEKNVRTHWCLGVAKRTKDFPTDQLQVQNSTEEDQIQDSWSDQQEYSIPWTSCSIYRQEVAGDCPLSSMAAAQDGSCSCPCSWHLFWSLCFYWTCCASSVPLAFTAGSTCSSSWVLLLITVLSAASAKWWLTPPHN